MRLPKRYKGYTVSKATLKIEDLIERGYKFLEDIRWHDTSIKTENVVTKEFLKLFDEMEEYLDLIDELPYSQVEFTLINIWEDFCDYCNEIAPKGTYFGSHEGDGSLFGFWEHEE